jgi:hypothetical protein
VSRWERRDCAGEPAPTPDRGLALENATKIPPAYELEPGIIPARDRGLAYWGLMSPVLLARPQPEPEPAPTPDRGLDARKDLENATKMPPALELSRSQ